MKPTLLHRLAVYLCAFGIFFCVASFASADSLILPQQYTYQGLTFDSPLTYITPYPTPITNLTFTTNDKITIIFKNINKPLDGVIVPQSTTPEPTATPTSIPSPTPTIFMGQVLPMSPTPEAISPTPMPSVTQTPPTYTPVPQANGSGLSAQVLFSMVNAFRKNDGLPAFTQDAKTCALAQERAPEVAGEVANGTMHSGLYALNLPYWNTENIIQMNSNQGAFNWWINDPIHREAILGNFTYSCVACSGDDCAEEFTNYQPK